MGKILKRILIYGVVYLILLMCAFTISNRIERLDDTNGFEKVSFSVFRLGVDNNS